MEKKGTVYGGSIGISAVIIIIVVSIGASYILINRGAGPSGTSGGTGETVSLTDITLSEAVTRAKSDATARGYTDAQLTYNVSAANFTRDGKASWSIKLFSSSRNAEISYASTGFEFVMENASSMQLLTSFADSSQIASNNQEIWSFADNQQSSTVTTLIDTYLGGIAPYHGNKAWKITVTYGPPTDRESTNWWVAISTGVKIS
ncbi:MAG: hypothetical protein AB1476_05725 [Candidatus Hadarchaeota archaeon]